MPLIRWINEYSVNANSIDNQHRQLIAIINALHKAIESEENDEVFVEIISYLTVYARDHFSYEERIMKNNSYPEYLAHKEKHDVFIRRLKSFQKDFQTGHMPAALQLKSFLGKWLKEHIVKIDQKYSSFLVKKGVV